MKTKQRAPRASAALVRGLKYRLQFTQSMLDATETAITSLRKVLASARAELAAEKAERGVVVAQLSRELARHAARAASAHRSDAKAEELAK